MRLFGGRHKYIFLSGLLSSATWNLIVSCYDLEVESNETSRSNIGLLLENTAYPKPGDIPVLNRKVFKAQRVLIREHPYVASVRRHHAHYLVGALLTRNVVISVAHPLVNVSTTELGVVLGENYADRGTAVATVLLVVIHQEFDPYTLTADIAMLRFFEDVTFRFSVKPISLVSYSAKLEGKAFVTGWGRCDSTGTELCLFRSSKYFPDERFDPMLQSVSFTMSASNYFCQGYKHNDVMLYHGMLCSGPAREEDPVCPCLAVPGAPLVLNARLVGLLSWGFGCGYGHDLPLVYTSVQYYSMWILDNIITFRKIKQSNLTQLFQATKAYLLAEWLMETRAIRPTLNIRQDKIMEPLDIDQELASLQGTVYDVRDFIKGGSYHAEKTKMYATLIYTEIKNEKMKMIIVDQKREPPHAFLSNNTLDAEYTWVNGTDYVENETKLENDDKVS